MTSVINLPLVHTKGLFIEQFSKKKVKDLFKLQLDTPVSSHPREVENVSVTGTVRLGEQVL